MAKENGKPKSKAEETTEERPPSRHPRLDSFGFEGPWTEADEIWLECMTGEYDRRLVREIHEREAAGSDL